MLPRLAEINGMQTTLKLLLLSLLMAQTDKAPAPIHVSYDDSMKSTEIKTNWLYVLNAPDQFLQMKLVARFRGKQMPQTGPTTFEIEVISQAPKHRYENLPTLIAVADGVEVKIGKMDQHPIQAFMGVFNGGQKHSEELVNNTLSPVPQSAAVLTQHKAAELVGEWIVTKISVEHLTTLARAGKIDWKLGNTEFSFNEIQLTRLRQFVEATKVGSGVVLNETASVEEPGKPLRTDTPSDANNSTLKVTLDWLKQQITTYAGDSMEVDGPKTLSLTKFNGCNIEWRMAPPASHVEVFGMPSRLQPMSLYFGTNLKDLDPQSVQVTRSGDLIRFATRNHEHRINLTGKYDNTRQIDNVMKPSDSASFTLKRNDLGGEMKEAFSHAIKLCQAGSGK
jgi:hypothetical protein